MNGTQNKENGTSPDGTLSRAHAPFQGDVPVVPWDTNGAGHGTQDTVAAGQGQSSAPLRDRPHPTVGTVADLKQEHKARMAADPRFGLWAAMGVE